MALVLEPRAGRLRALTFVAAAFMCLIAQPALVARRPFGFADAVTLLAAGDELAGRRLLVISDERGEGALVSAVAMHQPSPRSFTIRGSKLLAEDDWAGHNFHMVYPSAEALLRDLEALHLDFLVVDHSRAAQRLPYWQQVADLAANYADRLETVFSTDAAREAHGGRPITVYRLQYRTPGPAKRLRIDLKYSLGKLLEEVP
jgi:hypothetical protein